VRVAITGGTGFVGSNTARALLAAGHAPDPVPVVLTCGTVEENLATNRAVARALAAQGHDAALYEVRDAHNWTAWRDAFEPHLLGLLQRVWT